MGYMPPKPFCPLSLEGPSLTPWEHLKPQNIKPCLGGHCGAKGRCKLCIACTSAGQQRGEAAMSGSACSQSSALLPVILALSYSALSSPVPSPGSLCRLQQCLWAAHTVHSPAALLLTTQLRGVALGRETCLLRKPCFLWLEGGDVPLVFGAGFPSFCCDIFTYKGGFALQGAV